jgi:hypothetical protein
MWPQDGLAEVPGATCRLNGREILVHAVHAVTEQAAKTDDLVDEGESCRRERGRGSRQSSPST